MARAGSLALASAFALTLGTAACGSSQSSPDHTTPHPPTAAGPAPGTTPAPSALSESDLKARLLTAADLPAGFTPDATATEANGHITTADTHCQPLATLMNSDGAPPGATATAEASFTRSELGPDIATGLAAFPAVEPAQNLLNTVSAATKSCTTLTETDKDGTSYDFAVAPLNFPPTGDAATATRMSADIGGYPAQVDIVLTRIGSTLLYVADTGLGDADVGLTEDVVQRAVAKVRAA
ncbi:MAG: sensor domain-containing protein, partial [Catenulispora sp.]|nr:sensor domain-containing protein [Catenulispora sp.]